MGCNARDRIRRNNIRNIRIPKHQTTNNLPPERFGIPPSNGDHTRNPSPNFDETSWGYCTEDQLEEFILKNLELLYNEAMSKLVSLGYNEDNVLKAVLCNGHCYGKSDVVFNIVHNALTCLGTDVDDSDESELGFVNLKQLQKYSLSCMVCLVQQARPKLSKGDAMWCLAMSDLHVGRARSMEIPVLSSSCTGENENNGLSGIELGNCKFHGGWGFRSGEGGEFMISESFQYPFEGMTGREIECPKRFNLSPSLKSMLQRNVAMYAAGFREGAKANVVKPHEVLPEKSEGSKVNGKPAARRAEIIDSQILDVDDVSDNAKRSVLDSQILDVVNSVLSNMDNLNLEDKVEGSDPKNEIIQNLIHQVRDLEGQVKERKEWAHQKAMQAAKKLSQDLTELKTLRMEREETQWLKKGKQTLEDTTTKGLSEMEDALRKASAQVVRANEAVRSLETENAEIRAEMEASKLNASESVAACLQVAKREKKYLKKLLAWEKQKSKLQDEIAEEKQNIASLQEQLVLIKKTQKQTEVKWRQELKDKDLAFARMEEERRLKETVEFSAKRNTEILRRKIEIDSQCHKDDIQRLEQELSRLRASVQSTQINCRTDTISTREYDNAKAHGTLSDKEVDYDRGCMICKKDEASVVFLPCAHQVLCASCSQGYGKKGRAYCPCCRVQIEQLISVYGASS